jgi:pyruvate,water dikinase
VLTDTAQDQASSTTYLRNLDDLEGADLPLVGGKAFRLAVLKQNGFNVPSGLVLTTHFFETQLQHTKLSPLWAGSPNIDVTAEALGWLADALKTKPLAPKLAAVLDQYLNLILGPETSTFVVRSSVIDEDQRDHTFAGIHLTELSVPRSAIPIAITRCWASALSGPAIQYRHAHGMSIQSIKIAVLIQPMLSPDCSGVGFTLNPLTGIRDELVIEATWGLGNALVSGDIQPYLYRLASQPPDYLLLEQRAGNISPPPNKAGQAKNGPLSLPEITELARQLEQIQLLMGEPQDVEWARQNETFYLLQTRPIAVTPAPEQLLDQEWTRGNYAEDVPELPSPLLGALVERAQNQAVLFFQEIGLKVDNLGPYEKMIMGRPYLNLTLLKRGTAQVGINPDNFLHTMGYITPTTSGSVFSIDWRTAWQSRRVYRLALQRTLAIQQHVKTTEEVVAEAIHIMSNPNPEAPPADVLNQLRQQDRIYRALSTTNLGLTLASALVTGLGSRLIAPLTQDPVTTLNALALSGLKLGKDRLHQALRTLSQLARSNEQVRTYLDKAPDNFNNYAQNPAIPAEFKREFEDLLAEYGQRATYEADPSWPRYRDDPASLLRILRQYTLSRSPLDQDDKITDRPNLTGATETRPLLPWRQWLARPLIRAFRQFFLLRDRLDETKAKAMAVCRAWDLALGQRWVSRKWLAQPEDIFWLTLEEIERALIIGQGNAVTLSPTVQARKEIYQTYAKIEMPFYLQESQLSAIQLGVDLAADTPSDVAIGLPISPGQARGTVMVVRQLDDFEQLAGDNIILVMPSTAPAWLALLHSASGLIVETGGLLSHGSVIAREYGLPAVANIPRATQRFHTGDQVLIDGSTGVVQLLESGQS